MTSSIRKVDSGADVLLVYPSYETIIERRGRFLTTIPLGVAYLASALESSGFSVKILDLTLHRDWSIPEISSKILEINPRMLCFSLTSMGLRQAYSVIRCLKGSDFRGIIVVGGPHVTADPDVVGVIGADYGIMGEADYSLALLCRRVLRGEGRLEDIEGLIRGDSGGLIINNHTPVANLDSLGFPSRHLFETERYNYVSIITSRGCPFGCTYCTTAGSCFRQRGIKNVMEEVGIVLDALKPDFIGFVDNVFTLKRDFVVEFCNTVKKSYPEMKWTCATRTDLVDEKLLELMVSSGCDRISFGVESGVERIRFSLGKRISDKQYFNTFKKCRELGIKTSAYFMVGHMGETRGEIDQTVKFALELDPDDVFFTPTIILPKTRLMDYCTENKLISNNAWMYFMAGASDVPYLVPEEFKKYDVDTLQLYAMRRYFLDMEFVGRQISRTRSAGDLVNATKLVAGVIVDKVFIRQDIIPYEV
ncbi:MAG: radical SAM protein [Candidatus Altiarchaeota archaeon]|nr:radical SAM protein [Candidatus Altiarchaeota archaeon]